MTWALLIPLCLIAAAHTGKHTGLMLVGAPGYSWVCSQLTSQCYGNTESPWSKRTLQQCLGGNTAARLCSKNGKSQLKEPLSKVGNNSPSHEEWGFWQLQSGTKRIEVISDFCGIRAMAVKQGVCSQGQPSWCPPGSCPGQPCKEDIS